MKKKGKIIREHSGDNLHIEYEKLVSGDIYRSVSLILRPIYPISVFGENPTFEWEGNNDNEIIRVSLPRRSSEREAVITGNFPNEVDMDRGSTHSQLYDELRRVLRQLN